MTSKPTPLLRNGLLGLCGLFVALSAGCTQQPKCSELGTCGGNPLGDWVLGPGAPSCSEDLYQPPSDTRLEMGDQPAARTPIVEAALYDWCDLLVTNGGNKVAAVDPHFSFENGTIGAAFVHYDAIGPNGVGTYAVGMTRTGQYTIEFPEICIRDFGAVGDVCTALQTQLTTTATPNSVYKNLQCLANPADPQGCVCRFNVAVQSGGSGTYEVVDSHTLLHRMNVKFPSKAVAAAFPQKVSYCSAGGRLQLTGADDTYLFDEPGLRTMDLGATTINCADGVQGLGEDGVDCGLACPNACM